MNQYIDQRIEVLRRKIGRLSQELEELEKLSCNTEQLKKIVRSGLLERGESGIIDHSRDMLGKVHTQIIIDAE
jgi:sugar-specific transcriptional regulator TrmB